MRISNFPPLALLAVSASCLAEPLPTLRQGDTWRYQQYEVIGGRESAGPAVDVRVSYRTAGDRWVLATFNSPTSYAQLKRQGQMPILAPGPSIPVSSCIVDVVTGNNITQDRGCDRPLAQDEKWTFSSRGRTSEVAVTVESSALEPLVVPAGRFKANRLNVVVVESAASQGLDVAQPQQYSETVYWYSYEVRGMLRIERRFFDSQRTLTHSIVQVLTEFNNL